MTFTTLYQSNFTQGEISPYMYGRVDLAQYQNSARSIKNMIVRPQGGLIKRSGTRFVDNTKAVDSTTRLIPFVYSDTDAYVIEMGTSYFRFFRNQARVVVAASVITNGTFDTDLTGWTDIDTGTGASTWASAKMNLAGGAAGVAKRTQSVPTLLAEPYTLDFTVAGGSVTYWIGTSSGGSEIATGTASVGANTITFTPVAGTVYFSFSNANDDTRTVDTVSISGTPYEVSHTYTADQLAEVKYAQVYDSIFFVHRSHPVRQLTRTSSTSWTLSDVTFKDGPYYDLEHASYGGVGKDVNLQASATTGSVTLTAASAIFASTDVGRLVRFRTVDTAVWDYLRITAFTSTTVVTALVITATTAFAATTNSKQWRLGAFSETTGYPNAITFFEQRMVLAGTTDQQQTIWFSKSADTTRFQPDNTARKDAVDDDTAMTYKIADNKGNVIYWLSPLKSLYIGTSGGIWQASASTSGAALTPTTISIKNIVTDASSSSAPIASGSAIVFPHKFKRKIMEIGYRLQDDSFQAADLALLAEHRTAGYVKRIAIQRYPNYTVWTAQEDGTVSSLAYIREQNIIGWSQQVFGGTSTVVKDLCTIPGTYEDETWFIVQRTINGSTKSYVEYLTQTFLEQSVDSCCFMDSSLTYSGASTTTLRGLDHLEGQTVQCFGNGGQVVVSSVVTSGAITLDEAVTTAVVGLGYTASITTNSLTQSGIPANLQGKVGRIHSAVVRFYRSYGGEIGMDADNVDTIPELSDDTTMDGSLVLFSGDSEFRIDSKYSYSPNMYMQHTLPIPFAVTSITYKASMSNH